MLHQDLRKGDLTDEMVKRRQMKVAKVAGGGGSGLNPSNPEREVDSEEAKATTNKTPVQPMALEKAPLVERQEEGTAMREIGRGSTNNPKEETLDMQDSSLDPTDPLSALPWADIESIDGKEAEGRRSLDSPSERGTECRAPDPGEANPFTLVSLS